MQTHLVSTIMHQNFTAVQLHQNQFYSIGPWWLIWGQLCSWTRQVFNVHLISTVKTHHLIDFLPQTRAAWGWLSTFWSLHEKICRNKLRNDYFWHFLTNHLKCKCKPKAEGGSEGCYLTLHPPLWDQRCKRVGWDALNKIHN